MEASDNHKNTDLINIGEGKNMTELVNSMVHDFNNLLSIIAGLTQLTIMKTKEVETASNLKIINYTILDCKIALDKMCGYIIGSCSMEKDFHSIDEIVFSSLDMIRYRTNNDLTIGVDNINLDVELNSKEVLYCNKYEIRQVFLNIMVNAIHAMEDKGGVLTIRTYNKDDSIIIVVEDTGTGIEEEDLDNLFVPYYTTKGKKGTGLGLNIAQTIVENHSGSIRVCSQVSKGTKVVLTFPQISNVNVYE